MLVIAELFPLADVRGWIRYDRILIEDIDQTGFGSDFPFSQARVRSLIVELATNTTRVLQAFFDGIFRDSYCRF